MENKSLYIAASIILLVLAFFIISGNITGKLGSVYTTCTDSDGGDVPFIGGIVYFSSYNEEYEYKDYCFAKSGDSPKKWLNEYYCLPSENVQSRNYNCDWIALKCEEDENGAHCVNATESVCTDSDVGLDYAEKGSVCLDNECKEDFCIDENYLSEAYCNSGITDAKIFECSGKCKDGKCVEIKVEAEIGEVEETTEEEEVIETPKKESFTLILKKLFCKIRHSKNYVAYEECIA